jgi:hypothetical protein
MYSTKRTDHLLALSLSLLALTVYSLTLTPSLSFLSPDGSELATIPYVLGLAHSPGYPLYTWLGYLFSHLLPLGDVAYRINLMSAVLGALACGGVYLIALRLLPEKLSVNWRRSVSALSALLLAFSLTYWSQALIAEVYAANAFMIALTLLMLLRWERRRHPFDFFLFALSFGLSLGTHISDLGFAPAFVVFILLVIFDASLTPRRRLESLASVTLVGLLGFALGAAQFAWLPLRAGTLNDRAMLRDAPTTLSGLYNYTLGAFPQFKFAFPLTAIPDRLVIYLDLLRQQFGLAGITLGLVGLFALLFRRPSHFFLLVGMYLVHVWFFIQYRAFDLEVFFIPAHLLWALFMAFGLLEVLIGLRTPWRWRLAPRQKSLSPALSLMLCAALLTPSLIPLSGNWSANNFSQDTAIDDFYANLWQVLPKDAALVTQGGVFGYDAFYWQYVYATRQDVLLPMLPGPNPAPDALNGRDLYATTQAVNGNRGPGALPNGLLNQDMWQVPVLIGQQPEGQSGKRESLVLYHLTYEPPQLVVSDPQPQIPLDLDLGLMQLIGLDLSSTKIESGSALQIRMYWKRTGSGTLRVELGLDGQGLEQHEVGFGLLERYTQEAGLQPGQVVADQYWLVIPSTAEVGAQTLTIRTADLRGGGGQVLPLAQLDIVNEIGTVQRWLQIAQTGS